MIMMLLRNGWMGFCKNNSAVRYDNSQKGVIFMKKLKNGYCYDSMWVGWAVLTK